MVRRVFLVEQEGGGYVAEMDGQPLDVGPLTGLRAPFLPLIAIVSGAIAKMDGPTEVFVRPADVFVTCCSGSPVAGARPLVEGERVFRMEGDSRVYGEVVQHRDDSGEPVYDSRQRPVFVVFSDGGDIYREVDRWTPVEP